MKTITPAQSELIEAVLAERDVGYLTASIFEKDVLITECLCTLFSTPLPEGVALLFAGGTSLSKGYGVTARMSEDIDLKVVIANDISAPARKALMSQTREVLIAAMKASGLAMLSVNKFSQSQQVTTLWAYQARYPAPKDSPTALRENLQVELRLVADAKPSVSCEVRRLVDQFADEQVPALRTVDCVAQVETLAEKVVAWIRRRSITLQGAQGAQNEATLNEPVDRSLARHLYDVHLLIQSTPGLMAEATAMFPAIWQAEFRAHCLGSRDEAYEQLALAVASLADVATQSAEYAQFVKPLLFQASSPEFSDVLATFKHIAGISLAAARNA